MKNIDILLINPPFHIRNGSGLLFPLGLGYIISSIEAYKYTWDVIDCTKIIKSLFKDDLKYFDKKLRIELANYSPLIIGIGPCLTSNLLALEIITQCCNELLPSTPIVAGGPLASINGQEWVFFEKLGIEFIIKGDAEEAIPEVIHSIKKYNKISHCNLVSTHKQLYYNSISNIDNLPFPYRIFDKNYKVSVRRSSSNEQKTTVAIIASRGCNHKCRYCVSGNIEPNRIRKRTNENTVKEMEFLNSQHMVNDFIFYDDCFFNDPKNGHADIKAFCNLLLSKELNISWQMELRPDVLMSFDDNLINLLEKSGCRQINLGIEKTTDNGLQFLGKTSSLLGLREYNIYVKNISNIKLSATFIFGSDRECRNDILCLIDDSKKLGLDYAHYNPLFVYPGTPLYNDVFKDEKTWVNFILEDDLPWGEIVYENRHLKRSDLLELIDIAYASFYGGTELATQEMIKDRFNIKEKR